MADQPLPSPSSARKAGVPNRGVLDTAQSRFRAQLAKLARDPDTREQAGRLAAAAAKALDGLTTEAVKAEESSPKHQAGMRRLERRVAWRFAQAGRPLPKSLERPGEQP